MGHLLREKSHLFQGIHVHVGNIDDGAEATVAVQREAPESVDPPREFSIRRFGSMWHLMPDGRYAVTVTVDGLKDSTKLVSVAREGPENSEFVEGVPSVLKPAWVGLT